MLILTQLFNAASLVIVLTASALALLLGVWWARAARGADPTPVIGDAPPRGLGPAQVAALAGGAPQPRLLAATLLYLAAAGPARLVRISSGEWSLLSSGGWGGVDPVTRAAAGPLGLTAPGAVFVVEPTAQCRAVLGDARVAADRELRRWAADQRLGELSVPGVVGCAAAWAALAAAGYWALLSDVPLTAVPFAVFAAGAAPLLVGRRFRRPSSLGHAYQAHAAGFREYVSGRADHRATIDNDRYLACLPFAVAFGAAFQWERRRVGGAPAEAPTAAEAEEFEHAVARAAGRGD